MNVTPVFSFTWQANLATRCKKCQRLNGRTYIIDDIFQPVLEDPEYGPVWSLDTDTSLAHPHCKCSLLIALIDVKIDGAELDLLEGLLEH